MHVPGWRTVLLGNIPLFVLAFLGILPWTGLALALTNISTALALVLLLAVAAGAGSLALRSFGFLKSRAKLRLAFAPAVGFVLFAAYCGLAARLGIPPRAVFWGFCGVGAIAAVLPGRDLVRHAGDRVPGGLLLLVLSAFLALLFYRPGLADNNALLRDGRYEWIDVDAAYDTAVAASVQLSSPPSMPGMYHAPLVYHFGAYALAADLSTASGLNLGLSLKVLHGLGLLVLLASAAACSHVFGRLFGDLRLAGSFGVLGLFFMTAYSTLIWRAAAELHLPQALQQLRPESFTDPSQFFYGHSVLWGLIVVTLILGLLASEAGSHLPVNRSAWGLSLLAAHAVPLSIFGGAVGAGILSGVAVLTDLKKLRSWMYAIATAGLAVGVLALMGGFASIPVPTYALNVAFPDAIFKLTLWVFLALGLSVYGLRYALQRESRAVAFAVILACVGSIALEVFIRSRGGYNDQRWGLVLVQHFVNLLALVAISRPIADLIDGNLRSLHQETISLLRIMRAVAIGWAGVLAIASIPLLAQGVAVGRLYLFCFAITVLAGFLTSAVLAAYDRGKTLRGVVQSGLGLMLLLGLVSSYPISRVVLSGWPAGDPIYLSAGEYSGLVVLRSITSPADVIATNKHDIAERRQPGRSYEYFTVLGRHIVLEGFGYGEYKENGFARTQADNDLLFSTSDPVTAKRIVDDYGIRYIVCRPGTALQLPSPPPPWLKPLGHMGSLTVYQVQP